MAGCGGPSGRRSPLPGSVSRCSSRRRRGCSSPSGCCQLSLPLGLLVVLSAGLSSPEVLGRVRQSAGRTTHVRQDREPTGSTAGPARPDLVDPASQLTLPEAQGPLRGLDNRQLCRLWRDSFWLLRRRATTGTVLCVVAVREACLDELERRAPAAVHTWLDSGPRASDGPEKFLALPPGRDPEAAG